MPKIWFSEYFLYVVIYGDRVSIWDIRHSFLNPKF